MAYSSSPMASGLGPRWILARCHAAAPSRPTPSCWPRRLVFPPTYSQTENPHAGECWTAMEEAVQEIQTAVKNRDREGFCKVVRASRRAAWHR